MCVHDKVGGKLKSATKCLSLLFQLIYFYRAATAPHCCSLVSVRTMMVYVYDAGMGEFFRVYKVPLGGMLRHEKEVD